MSKDLVEMGPPASVVAIAVGGITLQDWLTILGILLLVLQIVWFVYDKPLRLWREKRHGRNRKR